MRERAFDRFILSLAKGIRMTAKGNVKRALVAFVAPNLTLVSSQVHATTDLDSGFGNGGRVITDISGRYDGARALAARMKSAGRHRKFDAPLMWVNGDMGWCRSRAIWSGRALKP